MLKYPIKAARSFFTKYNRQRFSGYDKYAEHKGEAANNVVREELLLHKPSMICKFGTTEFATLRNYLSMQEPKRVGDIWKYIKREKKFLWWWEVGQQMASLSGFFPSTDQMLERFSEAMFEDIKEIDILCSYIREEILIKDKLACVKKIDTPGLMAPYRYTHPWTSALEGKRVLVVHPFDESIRRQYQKRSLLFQNPKVLPEFELLTIKAVQTIAGNRSAEFRDWFDALDHMKDQMSNTDFDIALIGCGAYGMPLAAHAKRLGKKGVHMASYVQLLFGIYGKRWERLPNYAKFINEHWVKPLPSETPPNHKLVEGGAYW